LFFNSIGHAIVAALFSLDIMYSMEHKTFIIKDTSVVLKLRLLGIMYRFKGHFRLRVIAGEQKCLALYNIHSHVLFRT